MVGRTSDWRDELGGWLKPFLDRLGHKARRQMCPLYVSGLIGPGDRKSIQPMAERLALGDYDQLHLCVPKTKSERIDDGVRPKWRANS
jgi:SRSO17 transposase